MFILFLWRQTIKKTDARLSKYINIGIKVILVVLIVQVAVYVDARYIEPNSIKLERLQITNSNFPKDLNKLRVVQISDLHIEKNGYREHSLVWKVNSLKPDIILITGDFLNRREGLVPVISTLSKLRAKKGIFAVLGDIDYYAFRKHDVSELKTALKKININVLYNQNIRVPLSGEEGMWLIGLSRASVKKEIIKQAYRGVNFSEPKILLVHGQEIMDSGYINSKNADLVLVGDTHGTQMGIDFIRNFSGYASRHKYVAGLFYIEGVPLYVNRGIGTKTKPIRFFCRPEITLIKLTRG
ncbi:metallophosphoesterase [Candidatus Omnitrophota bacterium]